MINPFGPLSVDEFQQLMTAPHGEAVRQIRKIDPLYGQSAPESELQKWKVTLHQEVTYTYQAIVFASNEQEAKELAEALPLATLYQGHDHEGEPFAVRAQLIGDT